MKQLIVAAVAGMSFVPAFALTEYELDPSVRDTVVDWTSDASYKGGKAPTDFSEANVIVGAGTYWVDATTFDGFREIKCLSLSESNSWVVVNLGDQDGSLAGAVTGKGLFVKRGTGKLSLLSPGGVVTAGSSENRDYNVDIDVQEGILELPQSCGSRAAFYAGGLNIETNATVILAKGVQNWMSSVSKLSGAGTIMSETSVDFMPPYKGTEPCEFAGRINGSVRLYSSANIILSGTNSTMSGGPLIFGHGNSQYAVSVMSIGKAPLKSGSVTVETYPSSLGTGATSALQNGGGHLRYLGNGEVCDKTFKVANVSLEEEAPQGVIDGGPNGGLVLSGSLQASQDPDYVATQLLELTGSNRTACVFSGSSTIQIRPYNATKKNGPFTNRIHVIKSGPGTWQFAHSANRDGISGVTIKEGVVSFATLNEVGEQSSFGTGLMLDKSVSFYPAVCETYDPAHRVPYQFALGVTNSETVGTLALAGPTGCVCTTRPIAIAGCGALSNGYEAVRMCIAGVMPLGEGPKMLFLEGDSTAENMLMDVTNDVRRQLSIVKRGSGKWVLAENQAFGGDLRVEGGELVVRKPQVNAPFSYFRVTFKENWAELPNCSTYDYWVKYCVSLKRFSLYDAAGNQRNLDTAYAVDYASVAENEVAYGDAARRNLNYQNKGELPSALSIASGDWYGSGNGTRIYADKPETWVKLVYRLPAGEPVVAVDFMPNHTYSTEGTIAAGYNFGSNVKLFALEGSTDGVIWEPLFDQDILTDGTLHKNGVWYYGDNYSEGAAKGLKFDHTTSSRPAATVLPNVGTVSVSGGGTLRIEGEPVEIDSMEVNPLSGGTISNVTFAANGTLVVREIPEGSDIALPGTYQDVSGFEEIAENWTLDAGRKSKSYQIVNRNGELHLLKKGLVLIFR